MNIFVLGKKGSGKDTAYQIMSQLIPTKRIAFADALKQHVADLLAKDLAFIEKNKNNRQTVMALTGQSSVLITDSEVNAPLRGSTIVDLNRNMRELLQYIGTEIYRKKVSPSYWIDKTVKNIDSNKINVFTDCRFLNEFEAIKEKKLILNLFRNNSENDQHDSEISYLEIVKKYPENVINIDNNGTIENLETQIKTALLKSGLI